MRDHATDGRSDPLMENVVISLILSKPGTKLRSSAD
jgi:hypothetical protein